MINKTLIFKFGADGGGASVFRSDEGKFIETGSSGGMLDEDEDPIISWVKEFDSFEAWWKDFKQQHKQFWPFFYPIFINCNYWNVFSLYPSLHSIKSIASVYF